MDDQIPPQPLIKGGIMESGKPIMSDWRLVSSPFSPLSRDLYEITDEEIREVHKKAGERILWDEPYQALLAYKQERGMTWHQLAPLPFNRTLVCKWQSGEQRPHPKSIIKIKNVQQIADAEVPTPSPKEAVLAAT